MKINNQICFVGEPEDIRKIFNLIKSGKSQVDFSKIEPMGNEKDELPLDDYTNLCLNVYMDIHKDEAENLEKAFRFLGTTRQVPYEFKVLDTKDLCSARAQYQTSKLETDAERIIKEIKSKAIFNGYIIRDTFWGVGCGAYKPKVSKNLISFTTFDKAPIKLFESLSKKYNNVRMDYAYNIDNTDKVTELTIENGKVIVVKDGKIEEPNIYQLIAENTKI